MKCAWEQVDNMTFRLRVPGGWLYRYMSDTHSIYVPDATHVQ